MYYQCNQLRGKNVVLFWYQNGTNVIKTTTTTTTTSIFSGKKNVDLNSVVAQLGVLKPYPPPPASAPRRGKNRKLPGNKNISANYTSRSEPSLPNVTSTASHKNVLKQTSFTQSFQHFEADSGVESIESLSPKETTSSPIYSPAGNTEVLMTPQMSNVQTQNPILTSLLSVAFSSSSSQASSSSGSGPNAAAVANSNPLLTTLLNNTSQQSTTVQAWSSLDKEESLALPDNFRLKQ